MATLIETPVPFGKKLRQSFNSKIIRYSQEQMLDPDHKADAYKSLNQAPGASDKSLSMCLA